MPKLGPEDGQKTVKKSLRWDMLEVGERCEKPGGQGLRFGVWDWLGFGVWCFFQCLKFRVLGFGGV